MWPNSFCGAGYNPIPGIKGRESWLRNQVPEQGIRHLLRILRTFPKGRENDYNNGAIPHYHGTIWVLLWHGFWCFCHILRKEDGFSIMDTIYIHGERRHFPCFALRLISYLKLFETCSISTWIVFLLQELTWGERTSLFSKYSSHGDPFSSIFPLHFVINTQFSRNCIDFSFCNNATSGYCIPGNGYGYGGLCLGWESITHHITSFVVLICRGIAEYPVLLNFRWLPFWQKEFRKLATIKEWVGTMDGFYGLRNSRI